MGQISTRGPRTYKWRTQDVKPGRLVVEFTLGHSETQPICLRKFVDSLCVLLTMLVLSLLW